MKSLMSRGLLLAGFASLAGGHAEAGYMLTANAAGSQASTVAGVTTESFDSFQTGRYTSLTTAVGTLSSPGVQIVAADQYSGAGDSGHYAAIGAESGQTSATLTLNGSQSYFGLWWSAADSFNAIEFLSKGQVVAQLSSATAFGSLGSTYLGNPNGGDTSEKFAYLNVIGTGGSTFDQIIFLNNSTSTGFESDNWSVSASAPSSYPGTSLGYLPNVVPEPSSMALTASGLIGLVGLLRARRRR